MKVIIPTGGLDHVCVGTPLTVRDVSVSDVHRNPGGYHGLPRKLFLLLKKQNHFEIFHLVWAQITVVPLGKLFSLRTSTRKVFSFSRSKLPMGYRHHQMQIDIYLSHN